MIQKWLLWLDGEHSPWLNMAIDELLLEKAQKNILPLLRIYNWNCPAVSIGYVQNYQAAPQQGYSIVRRMTGGGVVYHDQDLTYTLIIPPSHPICTMNRTESYRIVHRAVKHALEHFGIKVTLADDEPPPTDRATMQCFVTPTRYDVIGDGKKYAGSAQRRTRNGILHQGSITLTATNGQAKKLQQQLVEGFEQEFNIKFTQYNVNNSLLEQANILATDKYSSEAWNKFKKNPCDK
jgi:lipoyl(octanoyl) transferase